MGNKHTIWVVQTTFSDEQKANYVASELVLKKMAACATVFPEGKSFFFWNGQCSTAQEYTVMFKTIEGKVAELKSLICAMHSYQLPMILAWPIPEVLDDYAKYVIQACDS